MRGNNSSHLSLINECVKGLSKTGDPTKLQQQFCSTLVQELRLQFCAITTYDSSAQRLELRASHGLYVEELQDIVPDRSISASAFRLQRTQNIPLATLAQNHPELMTSKQLAKRCHSLLAVPLIAQGHAIGILTLGRAARQAFPQTIVAICEVLAPTIASFLQSTELSRQNAAAATQPQEEPPEAPVSPNAGRYITGRAISPGVCLGRCLMLASDDALRTIPIARSNNAAAERERLRRAYELARQALVQTRPEVADILAEADDSLFDMLEILLDDPTLKERIEGKLAQGYELNSALALTFRDIETDLGHLTDEYLRERIHDIEDVLLRLLNAANNQSSSSQSPAAPLDDTPIVLVARELFPSQLLASPLRHVCGIVCESGGATSHATILARALHIPMLVDLPDIQKIMRPGDQLLVDGGSGLCFPSPSEKLLSQYHLALTAANRQRRNRTEPTETPVDDTPTTRDGTPVKLCGNITLFSEMSALHAAGIREIGLYRTEFMFMIRNTMPDEETQYRVISRLVNAAQGAPVAIRALDIGGDKPLSYVKWGEELNPSLGWRGLRFLLSNPDFLRPQLRAILRASVNSNVSLTFPMVSDRSDLRRAREAVEEAKRSLQIDRVPYGNPKIGMMLELPSAVVCLDSLLPDVDFVSIGTNDLVQYLFAVDRGNSHVTKWFQHNHPVVLKLLGEICATVARHPGKCLQLCGELAGSWHYTPLLLGAGLRRLSMNPSVLPSIRDRIRSLRLSDCEELYRNACECDDAEQVYRLVAAFNRQQRGQ